MELGSGILFLVSNDHQTDQRMQRICSTLHEGGYNVTLLGRYLGRPKTKTKYNVKLLNLKRASGPLFYYELMQAQIRFAKQMTGVNVISSVDADTLLAACKIAKYHKAKHIHDAHELFTEVPELEGKWLKRIIWKIIERITLQKVNRAYTVSPGLKEFYEEICSTKFDLIYNYPTLKNKCDLSPKYDVIYQGAVNKGRCVDLLIKSAIKFNFSVVICGEGDELNRAKLQANKARNIVFMGAVMPNKLHEITSNAKIGFNVLDNSSDNYDKSLPNKTFDYIMAGKPQLISESHTLSKLNNKKSFANVVVLTVDSIGKSVISLLNNKKQYDLLSNNCMTLRKVLNWDSQKEHLLSIYENV